MDSRPPGDTAVEVPIEDQIDLHAFHPRDVSSVVDEYLHAAAAAGLPQVRLIHGRGRGVQRAAVHRVLARHEAVEEYWDAGESHLGATVARLTRPDSTAGGADSTQSARSTGSESRR